MKQEDKDLLLRDLCARLPYGVKIKTSYNKMDEPIELRFINPRNESFAIGSNFTLISGLDFDTYECKPYLFPLSSMTEEQRIEASFEFDSKKYKVNIFGDIESYSEIGEDTAYIGLESIGRYIDWLNKNHFDYRGLIEKGLAIDCTNLNIY